MSAATRPTKIAAIASIVSMMRSMTLRFIIQPSSRAKRRSREVEGPPLGDAATKQVPPLRLATLGSGRDDGRVLSERRPVLRRRRLSGRYASSSNRHPERSAEGAKSRDLLLATQQQNRSLHYASLRSPPVGMTEGCYQNAALYFAAVAYPERSAEGAKSRDLLLATQQQNRSLHYASLRSPPVGMTEGCYQNAARYFAAVAYPERSAEGAKSRDLLLATQQQNRSLHYASLRSPPVGMTGRLKATPVLGHRRLEVLVDRVGIAAGLLDRLGPCLLQRRDGGLPGLELVGRQGIDLVIRQSFHLGAAGGLEIVPWRGQLHRPLGRAVVVDHLLL